MEIHVTHTLMLSDDAKRFLSELFGKPTIDALVAKVDPLAAVEALPISEPAAPSRAKKVPPGIACTRIGQDTAAEIMKLLPAPIEVIETSIKRKRADAEALLKLLWERNKLGYDGEVYHELT